MSLPNIISEINTIKSTYLPLSGGVMSGNLIFNTGVLSQTASANEIILFASSDKTTSSTKSCLAMRNENHETEPGSFYIRSVHDGVSKVLKLKPDGTFTWNGNNVITSAGGTMTGGLNLNNIGSLSIANGDWVYPALLSNTSSGFYAISGNSPKQAGEFLCRANKDGSNFIDLRGCPDGTLTWGNKPVVSIIYEAGGIITYSNALTFQWGSAYGSTTVNFPQPFSGYPVVYTTNNSVSDSSCNATTYVTGITPTYFTTYKIRGNSSNQVQDGGQFSWIALGYR